MSLSAVSTPQLPQDLWENVLAIYARRNPKYYIEVGPVCTAFRDIVQKILSSQFALVLESVKKKERPDHDFEFPVPVSVPTFLKAEYWSQLDSIQGGQAAMSTRAYGRDNRFIRVNAIRWHIRAAIENSTVSKKWIQDELATLEPAPFIYFFEEDIELLELGNFEQLKSISDEKFQKMLDMCAYSFRFIIGDPVIAKALLQHRGFDSIGFLQKVLAEKRQDIPTSSEWLSQTFDLRSRYLPPCYQPCQEEVILAVFREMDFKTFKSKIEDLHASNTKFRDILIMKTLELVNKKGTEAQFPWRHHVDDLVRISVVPGISETTQLSPFLTKFYQREYRHLGWVFRECLIITPENFVEFKNFINLSFGFSL